MILVVDNYDSFVHNLARYFQRLGQETLVVRNDQLTAGDVRRMAPQAMVLSPGPCAPNDAGSSLALVQEFHQRVPMLGVCLGHQTIVQALGGNIVRAEQPVHGQSSVIWHDGQGLFRDLPSPLEVGRYHSLVVDPKLLPDCLEPTAWTTDKRTLMAVAHRELPVMSLQFHPESILTVGGYQMLANFLDVAGLKVPANAAELATGELASPTAPRPLPTRPVTF